MRFQIPERKIRMAEHGRHAPAIEEMGVSLCGQEDPGCFPMAFATVPVYGAGDQARRLRGCPAIRVRRAEKASGRR